jgi:hypothetical protein
MRLERPYTFVIASTYGNTSLVPVLPRCFVQSTSLGAGYGGDDGPAISAQINNPQGLWITTADILYIADYNNHRIRKVSGGIISTVAGTGTGSYTGDNVLAVSGNLRNPSGVFMDTNGRLYTVNQRIRLVSPANSFISTFAGTGTSAFNGDNLAATATNLNGPWDVKGDSFGNIYIAENSARLIRMIDTNGLMTILFGAMRMDFLQEFQLLFLRFDLPRDFGSILSERFISVISIRFIGALWFLLLPLNPVDNRLSNRPIQLLNRRPIPRDNLLDNRQGNRQVGPQVNRSLIRLLNLRVYRRLYQRLNRPVCRLLGLLLNQTSLRQVNRLDSRQLDHLNQLHGRLVTRPLNRA